MIIATPLNWIVRPAVLWQFIWYRTFRIFAGNCAKAAFFATSREDNGQEMTKFHDEGARERRSTGSEFQGVECP